MSVFYKEEDNILAINSEKGKKLILLNKIVYIKAEDKASIIFLDNAEVFRSTMLLKRLENDLPKQAFFRCHNSYIVSFSFVDCFTGTTVILRNNITIPLSRGKKSAFMSNLKAFLYSANE